MIMLLRPTRGTSQKCNQDPPGSPITGHSDTNAKLYVRNTNSLHNNTNIEDKVHGAVMCHRDKLIARVP